MKPFSPLRLFTLSSLFLFIVLLAACTATPTPTIPTSFPSPPPLFTPSPTPASTATPLPSATLVPTNLPAPTATPTQAPLEPLIRPPFMNLAGWSADSRWIAFWTYTQEEVDSLPSENLSGFPPGVLHFYDVFTSAKCDYPFPAHYSFDQPAFAWQMDGRAAVRGDDGVVRLNTPCQEDFSTVSGTEAEMLLGNPEFSPNGIYQAHAEIETDNENGIVSYHLTITDLTSGGVMNTLDWQVPLALGTYTSPGGEWIRDDLFLVSRSLERGPILIRVGEEPQYVIPDLFNLSGSCVEQDCEHSVFASASANSITGNFHIALWAFGLENAQADVLLYHSENEEVEALPFEYLRSPFFSPDGQWLLLDPTGNADELWMRPVDPVGNQAVLIGKSTIWMPAFSSTGDQMAFSPQMGLIEVLTLPDSRMVNRWNLAPFEARQIMWSPNGTSLAVQGAYFSEGNQEYALFLIQSPGMGNVDAAQQVLIDYFSSLQQGEYEQARQLYGGTYEVLANFNPDLDPKDQSALFERVCHQLRCLKIRNIVSAEQTTPTEFHFVVEFQNEDSTLFILGPCCGASEEEMPPVSQFEYTVVLGLDGKYRVMGLPVYVP